MKRDIRDPSIVGDLLIESAKAIRKTAGRKKIPLSQIYDEHLVRFAIADMVDAPTSIERYGKPDEIEPVYAQIRVK